jgi:hypothetical protein
MITTRNVLQLAALSLGLTSAACVPGGRPTMNPGVDCNACHTVDPKSVLPSASDEPGHREPSLAFTFGGTVYTDSLGTAGLKGVHLMITDALGHTVDAVSNEAGNFFSNETVDTTQKFSVSIEYPAGSGKIAKMGAHPTPTGLYGLTTLTTGIGCNGCHSQANYQNKPGPAGTDTPQACAAGSAITTGLATGQACGSLAECCSQLCVDNVCSDTPGDWGHSCTDDTECAAHIDAAGTSFAGFCRNSICAGANGRITVPDGLASDQGNYFYQDPLPLP